LTLVVFHRKIFSRCSKPLAGPHLRVSASPVIATHNGLRNVNNIPKNMPDPSVKKLAAKGSIIGFQIGSEFS
jgi:microsomal dipeptidase-like Zn-dependent dipeptidase